MWYILPPSNPFLLVYDLYFSPTPNALSSYVRFGHQGATYCEARGPMKVGGNVKVDTKAWVAKGTNNFEWMETNVAWY